MLGDGTPRSLLNAVFFLNGKNFALRGGSEHHNLKTSRLVRMDNPSAYKYTENGSKNHSGGSNDKSRNKEVVITADPELGKRCHVYLLDLYLSKLPNRVDYFYNHPLSEESLSSTVWYTSRKIGVNFLQKMVRGMCSDGGVTGRKTNHRLRATAATQMYEAGVPEKMIQERIGHRSVTALREYERTSMSQTMAVAKVLSASEKRSYSTTLGHMMPQQNVAQALPQHKSTGYTFNNCVVNFNIQSPSPMNFRFLRSIWTSCLLKLICPIWITSS